MKPEMLILQAYTAYPTKQVIDFRQLGTERLMMISGETGAGKTAVLDAMTYGLFGQSSGGLRPERSLRSDHARKGLMTFVDFRFEVNGQLYRVHRMPSQPGRSNGLVEFYELDTLDDESGTPKATGKTKVDGFIRDLLGYSIDQFRSVVMLPQGQFREFLSAKTREKADLLASLFKTQRYASFQSQLKKKADELGKAQADDLKRIGQCLKLAQVPTEDELFSQIQDRQIDVETHLNHRAQQSQLVRHHESALTKAKALNHAFEQLDSARERASSIASQETDITAKKKRLKAALAAEDLRDTQLNLEQRVQECKRAEVALKTNILELEQAQSTAKERDEQFAVQNAQQGEVDALRLKLEDVRKLRAHVQELNLAKLAVDQQVAETEQIKSQLVDCQSIQGQHDAKLTEFEATLAKMQTIAQHQATAILRLERCTVNLNHRHRINELVIEQQAKVSLLESTEAKLHELTDTFQQRKSRHQVVYQQHLSDYAARLAEGLTADQPCPVCGSFEHPRKADEVGDAPSAQDVQLALTAMRTIEEAQAKARSLEEQIKVNLDALGEKQEQLIAELGEAAKAGIEELEVDYENAVVRAEEAEQARLFVEESESHYQALKTRTSSLADASKKAARDVEAALRELAVKQTRMEERMSLLPTPRPTLSTLDKLETDTEALWTESSERYKTARDAQHKAAQRLAASSAKCQASKSTFERAKKAKAEAQDVFNGRLQAAQFETLDAYEVCLMSHADRIELDNEINSFAADKNKNQGLLNHLEAELKGLQRPDLGSLDEQVQSARHHLEFIEKELEASRNTLSPLLRAQTEISELKSASDAREAEYGCFAKLRDIAFGKAPNRHGVQFEKYILATILDEVLVFANARFKRMSGGRYALQRKDPDRPRVTEFVQDNRSEAGLELEVTDAFTGKERDASTLSGGEGFQAALALALGLADVVQAKAGGIQLSAMFIDEGFGTQSEDALDAVMDTLTQLQSAGRLIGLISHVPEMRARIPVRLHVQKEPTGSRVQWIHTQTAAH